MPEKLLVTRYEKRESGKEAVSSVSFGHEREGGRKRQTVSFHLTVCSIQVAEGALFSLKHLQGRRAELGIPLALHSGLLWSLQLEEAKLYWERGEVKVAMGQLKTLLQSLESVSS